MDTNTSTSASATVIASDFHTISELFSSTAVSDGEDNDVTTKTSRTSDIIFKIFKRRKHSKKHWCQV